MKDFFKSLKDTQIASLILFFIVVVYLFPAFLGYIDTPVDIRDIRMYPWRYHEVDQKIINKELWQGEFPQEQSVVDLETKLKVFNFKANPGETKSVSYTVNWNKLINNPIKLRDVNYFFSFDFKTISQKSVSYDLGIVILNDVSGASFAPGAGISPLLKKTDGTITWYKAFFPLNNFIGDLKKLSDLQNCSIQIVLKNKDKLYPVSIYIKDFKLASEDFSKIKKVHNHYNNDLVQMFTPFREFFSQSIKKAQIPFWNNYVLSGVEFLAEPQVGFFHPLYFLSYLIFDHFTAHEILTFVCFFLGGLGAFLLSRFWGLNLASSLFTSIVYMFQPFNVTWSGYEHMLMNSAAFPFLLLSFEKCLISVRFASKYLIFSSLLLGLILISGHLQYIYYTLIFFILFAFFRVLFIRRLTVLFKFLFILTLGFMIGAIVVVPFLDLFNASHRTANPEGLVKATSVPLHAFLGLFTPFYKGIPEWPLSGVINVDPSYNNYKMGFARNYVYFGLIPFLVSLFSIRLIKDKLVLFFYFLIVFSLLICMGSPLFFVLRELLPGFKEMQHYRFLQLYSYSVPFLAGFGLQAISNYLRFSLNKKLILFSFVLLITVFDLINYSSFFQTWSRREDYKPVHNGGVLEFVLNEKKNSKEHFRVLPFVSHKVEGISIKPDIAEPNTLLPYGIEDASGYSSFIPRDIYYSLVYIQTMDSKKLFSGDIFDLFSNINTPYPISNFHSMILDLLNVKYFIVPNFITIDSGKVEKVFQSDCTIYKNKKYLPRAFFASKYKIIKEPKDVIAELENPSFNALNEVILSEVPEAANVSNNAFSESQIKVDYKQNEIILKAMISKPGFLVLGNNLNNNWKVKINGKKAKHYEANLLQRAVYLPKAGDYVVNYYYFPRNFLIGLFITGIALLLICLLSVRLSLQGAKRRSNLT